jgi:predicted nuclease of predicted toxin-antitoxin system
MPEPLRFYFDEHIDPVVAAQVRARGIDVLTTAEAARAGLGTADSDQLAYATEQGRVLVTSDRDFISLATTQMPHAGIILLQRPLSVGQTVEYLESAAQVIDSGHIRDRLVYCHW